jgi:hypothetical protein
MIMRSTDSVQQPILRRFSLVPVLAFTAILSSIGCAAQSPQRITPVSEEGLNVVRIETTLGTERNTHPVALTPAEVGTILRGVRVWERRNVIHRLVSGEAPKTRAFRDDELSFLAPAISRALAQAGPSDHVYFHVSHATPTGEEETTTGRIFIRDPILHLVLNEVHDRHGPGPNISRYDRQMPDIPQTSGSFDATFEPEQYLVKVRSGGGWFSADQREELLIRYRDALPSLPVHPLSEKAAPQPSQ